MTLKQNKSIDFKSLKNITNKNILSLSTNKINKICILCNQYSYILESNIIADEKGLLNFFFSYYKTKKTFNEFEKIISEENIKLNNIHLYKAKDLFCKEEALEFVYNEDKSFYVLIYTDLVEMTLEFFHEKLSSDKFTKVNSLL